MPRHITKRWNKDCAKAEQQKLVPAPNQGTTLLIADFRRTALT